ncbi:hypothetical protein PCASD_00885 [Puccinia coronata f. sp. avenae]|uniref:Eukaryotic translation initiation factor 3 subunit C N-terminal domain-containing protein n=1 Tax=Puccinia coronata f. sp. avenae TaxID=200324 RepID=A0A2N5VPM0_9BASI|nr:hypothetical protein PCASD_00885 [Puccinia coronata f. sp. avenae]
MARAPAAHSLQSALTSSHTQKTPHSDDLVEDLKGQHCRHGSNPADLVSPAAIKERAPDFNATKKLQVRGSLISLSDRLDDEFTKSLQNIDPHKPNAVIQPLEAAVPELPSKIFTPTSSASDSSSYSSSELIHLLCAYLYKTNNSLLQTRAALCQYSRISTWDTARVGIYSGQLPATNAVGIPEATLVAKPSAQLMTVLEKMQRIMIPPPGSSSLETPRSSQVGLMMPSHTQFSSTSSPALSWRNPSLTNARIGGVSTMMSNTLASRPTLLNGHTVHSNISKLQILQQQQQQQQQQVTSAPVSQHHHPALQAAEVSIPPPGKQTDQQCHLQQLQVSKLLGSTYTLLPTHHRLSSNPAPSGPSWHGF